MERHGFRTLAPATRPRSPPPEPDPLARRKRTSVACDLCRGKRTGCDGARPACAACRRRNTVCTYMNQADMEMRPTVLKRENTALRQKVDAFRDLISRLDSMPQHTAQHVLQRLKTGSDPTVVLKSLQGQPPEIVPSAQELARAMLPPIHSNCEFELLLQHPNAFPLLDLSQRAQSIGNALAKTSSSSADDSSPAASSSPSSMLFSDPQINNHQAESRFALGLLARTGGLDQSSSSTAPDYWDPRLAHLNIDFWTTVPISNAQAASAISFYLEAQHQACALFDAGLFVRDLIELRFDFCSPFLVVSLLAIASLFNASRDPEASSRSFIFEQEAEKLLQSETNIDSLSTIAGMGLLYMSLSFHGENLRASQYLVRAVQEAKRLKLFGVPKVLEELDTVSRDVRIASSATAWGLFDFNVHTTRFYIMPPILYPPKLPLPGEHGPYSISEHGARSGLEAHAEKLARLDPFLATFSKCWTIVNEVHLVYRDQETSAGTLAFALSKYSRLLRLCDELPDSLIRKEWTENNASIFHQTVHLTILDIFRPFVALEEQHDFRSYLPQGASPRTIYAASVKQLKGLIFEYTYQHAPSHYSLYFPAALIYAVNAVTNDKLDPEQYSYFSFLILVTLRFCSVYKSRGIYETVQAFLAIAHDRGVITIAEAVRFKDQFGGKDYAKDDTDYVAGNGFVVDMDLAVGDTAAATVDSLANRFGEITLFNEFTNDVI